MALTYAAFTVLYPEFAAVGEDYWTAVKTAAALELNPTIWRTLYDRALGLLTAHYLSRMPEGAGSAALVEGAPALMSTGSMSVAFSGVSARAGDEGDLSATGYGQAFLRLRRQTVRTARVV